jgi:ABC-type multidrug transport system fused ATPase/permease subunit
VFRRPRGSFFKKLRGMSTAWRQYRPFLGGARSRLVLLTMVAVCAGVIEAILLALVAALATALSEGSSRVDVHFGVFDLTTPLTVLFVVGVGMALVRAGVQLSLAYLPAKASAAVMVDLRRSLFDRFTGTSWAVQASERDGHLQTLMGQHVMQASHAIGVLAQTLTAVLMFMTLLISAMVLSVMTAVIVIVASLLLFLLLGPLVRRLRRQARALSRESIEHAKGVEEVVMMAEEIQVFGASPAYKESVDQLSRQVRRPMMVTRFLLRALPGLYQSLAFLTLFLALAAVYFSGAEAIAELGAVVLIMVRSLTYGQQIQQGLRRLDELTPFMNSLRKALDHYESHPRQDGDSPLPRIDRLGMRDVRYAYVPGEDVLKGISFEAHGGEAIGIVGPSGAGKSSLVQILLRLRQPTGGALEVNGVDARAFRRDDWQQRVSYVPQSPQLIWGTVADNIRFYRPEIDDEQVERAARLAHIHDEIMSWSQGYQTVIGQRVSAISGGQRQRLCLARALAGSPDVLILDEPTSALDVRSELAVQESLAQIKSDVLLILVAHRLSTLSVCDRVMVVVDGRLQAMDEPAVLLENNDFYREVTEITQRQGVATDSTS